MRIYVGEVDDDPLTKVRARLQVRLDHPGTHFMEVRRGNQRWMVPRSNSVGRERRWLPRLSSLRQITKRLGKRAYPLGFFLTMGFIVLIVATEPDRASWLGVASAAFVVFNAIASVANSMVRAHPP